MGGKKTKITSLFVLLIVLVGALLVWKTTNDYKEKKLSDIINYDATKFEGFAFEYRGDDNDVWNNDGHKTFEELLNFLSKYKVKKVKNTDVKVKNKEDGFDIFVSVKGKSDADMYTFWENYVSSGFDSDHYELVNGPIDMEWIKAFNEKNQASK